MNSMDHIKRENKKAAAEMKYLSSPCTLTEAAQIARGVAEDVVADYHNRTGHLHIALTLQVEILKDIVIKAGLITEEEFQERYIQQAEEFNKLQQAAVEEKTAPADATDMTATVNDIEVQKV